VNCHSVKISLVGSNAVAGLPECRGWRKAPLSSGHIILATGNPL